MKIYLAGPMRGYPQFNFPAFFAAAKRLRAEGHEVFNPAEHDIKNYGSLKNVEKEYKKNPAQVMRDVIRKDLLWIIHKAEMLYVLPGWQKSKGVAAEIALAKFLGLRIKYGR
jgi:hypothetical protein